MTGKFKCMDTGCGYKFEHSWTGGPIEYPNSHAAVQCKRCNHSYVEWLNYDKLFPGNKK